MSNDNPMDKDDLNQFWKKSGKNHPKNGTVLVFSLQDLRLLFNPIFKSVAECIFALVLLGMKIST